MKARFLALWSVAVLAAAAAFVTYLALRFETVRLGYELDEANQEHKQLRESVRLLTLETQTLREQGRVQAIARRTLGMEVPGQDRIIPIDRRVRRRRAAGRSR